MGESNAKGKMKRLRTTISELVCLGILTVLVYPLYTVCRSLGFDHGHSWLLIAAFAIASVGVFFGACCWLESKRARKRIQNWEKEFEELSLEEKIERSEKQDTPLNRYIEEKIRRGDLTREEVEEMATEAHSAQYSPEIARQGRETARRNLNRLLYLAVLYLILLIVFCVVKGLFP